MTAFDLLGLQSQLREFAAARDWEQFHTPKNLAMALIGEAAEIVELFQWLTPEQSDEFTSDPEQRRALEDEIADVMIYLARLADVTGVDVGTAVAAKMERNSTRFPPSSPTATGTHHG
jgi:NTP pyrophosphatase (non-canonical NTP hydrolase)